MLARAVTSFSEPGATVLLLPWPDPGVTSAARTPACTTHDDSHPADLAAAVATVAGLERHPRTTRLPATHGRNDTDHPDGLDATAVGSADLLITVMPARHDTAQNVDTVARHAAHSLRLGGVLAVLTHCDWEQGVLTDPSGPMVTAGQNADLLYLQHIVAVHLPPDDPRLRTTPAATATGAQTDRAHRRVHSDVLVFAQPHDHTAGPVTRTSSPPNRYTDPEGSTMPHSAPEPTGLPASAGSLPEQGGPDLDELPQSVWATGQRPPATQRRGRYVPDSTAHPAKMLPAVAAHAIAHYTRPGDLVLDPMCGIGTTLVEAIHLGRRALGVEYEPHWVDIARANLDLARTRDVVDPAVLADSRVLHGDARQLATLLPPHFGQAALVVTSPPYGPSTHGQVSVTPGGGVHKYHHRYGNLLDRGNLANIGHHRLLAGFQRILAALTQVLRPGAHVAITVRPWREHAELIDLPAQILTCGTRAGLIPVERCVALLGRVFEEGLVARGSFFQRDFIRKQREAGLPLHLIAHEDVLVFRTEQPADPASGVLGPRRNAAVRAAARWRPSGDDPVAFGRRAA